MRLLRFLTLICIFRGVVLQCPYSCRCENGRAECIAISSLTGFPLPESVRHVKIEASSIPVIGPRKFGKQTETIEVSSSEIGEIHAATFSNLHKLSSLHFKNTVIHRIMGCAFHGLLNSLNIEFSSSQIDYVEPAGFSDINSKGNFTISSSIFRHVEYKAFWNIRSYSFSIFDTRLDQIDHAAFAALHDIEHFSFLRSTVGNMSLGAFYDIGRIQNVKLNLVTFEALYHSTLMELWVAVPDIDGKFEINSIVFPCDCNSAPVVESLQRFHYDHEVLITCRVMMKDVSEVSLIEICPNYQRQKYCQELSEWRPTCVDSNDPRSRETAMICPTEIGPAKGSKETICGPAETSLFGLEEASCSCDSTGCYSNNPAQKIRERYHPLSIICGAIASLLCLMIS